ncbi:MAG: hypothetical protein GX994_04520 [Firmicutes bacterium]|nr:hypothetical protein [Bacillota bacterium]
MKMLITIIPDRDVAQVLDRLTTSGFSATKLASTSGFLRVGNTTLMIGVEDHEVSAVMDIVKEKAVVFTLDVERFERI